MRLTQDQKQKVLKAVEHAMVNPKLVRILGSWCVIGKMLETDQGKKRWVGRLVGRFQGTSILGSVGQVMEPVFSAEVFGNQRYHVYEALQKEIQR